MTKIALMLDGLLCDRDGLEQEWERRIGDKSFLKDEAYWAALQPYEDISNVGSFMKGRGWETYLFVERPKSLYLVTRSWARRNAGIVLPKNQVIMQAIKRYDCRLNGIEVLITGDAGDLDNLKTETVAPIAAYCVDRSQGMSLVETLEGIG